LVAEVPASQAGRRAFVDITPRSLIADPATKPGVHAPGGQGGVFRVEHWEYDADDVEGWDYDVSAVLVRSAVAACFMELTSVVVNWHLRPDQFDYPWNTDDPR
jgi:hypothetical protein